MSVCEVQPRFYRLDGLVSSLGFKIVKQETPGIVYRIKCLLYVTVKGDSEPKNGGNSVFGPMPLIGEVVSLNIIKEVIVWQTTKKSESG